MKLSAAQLKCLRKIAGTFITETTVEGSGNQRKTYRSLYVKGLVGWDLSGYLRLTDAGHEALEKVAA